MTALALLIVFVTGFISVFALGFQSRNVNSGNYGWAAGTSFFVGISQASLWTHIAAANSSIIAWLTYGLSGAVAITSSMYVHQRFIQNGRSGQRRETACQAQDISGSVSGEAQGVG